MLTNSPKYVTVTSQVCFASMTDDIVEQSGDLKSMMSAPGRRLLFSTLPLHSKGD